MGGFDSAFRRNASEDRDFCDRWLLRGRRLVTAPDAVILHFREMSVQDFWKQHFRYGCGAFTYATARRLRNAGPVPFEGWRLHIGLIVSPLGTVVGSQIVLLVVSYLCFASCSDGGILCGSPRAKPETPSGSLRSCKEVSLC